MRLCWKSFFFFTKKIDFSKIRYKNVQYFNLGYAHKPIFGLVFFSAIACMYIWVVGSQKVNFVAPSPVSALVKCKLPVVTLDVPIWSF